MMRARPRPLQRHVRAQARGRALTAVAGRRRRPPRWAPPARPTRRRGRGPDATRSRTPARQAPDRAERHRVQAPPGASPLGRGTNLCLARALPPADDPPRAPRGDAPRISAPRLRPHLLELSPAIETRTMGARLTMRLACVVAPPTTSHQVLGAAALGAAAMEVDGTASPPERHHDRPQRSAALTAPRARRATPPRRPPGTGGSPAPAAPMRIAAARLGRGSSFAPPSARGA